MKPKVLLTMSSLLLATLIHAQTEKFDIATFIPPKGWERVQSHGIVGYQQTKTENGLVTFCQITLYPSRKSSGDPAKDFSTAWQDLLVKVTKTTSQPTTETKRNPDGWTVVTGLANITVDGISYTCVLVNASGFDKTMSAVVKFVGTEYITAVDEFFNHLDLDSKGVVSESQLINPGGQGVDNYSFIAPENWIEEKGAGYTRFAQVHGPEQVCVLTIIAAQPSSGNLENDVKNIFNQMYPDWRFYYPDHRRDELMKGHTRQGLEYCMMEAAMIRDRQGGGADYENGAAMVIGMGREIAIVSLRHESTGARCQCKQKYENWPRFFNSFIVKNINPPENKDDISKRIIGSWNASGSNAMGEYVFAANGRYQYIGGHGGFSQQSSNAIDYIELKTSAFKGDGVYSIRNDQLILKKQGQSTPDSYRFRMEKVNKGSTGWKDRLILLNENPADKGRAYEVMYEKIIRK